MSDPELFSPKLFASRLCSPSAARNRGPILAVLTHVLPELGEVLEVASGTGEHVAHFAAALPGLRFQPSDTGEEQRASIDAWTAGLPNVRRSIALDTTGPWPDGPFDAVLCANMIHIAPWEATIGLVASAAGVLRIGGQLITYGPYRRRGAHTAPGNEAFDANLRERDASWGVRDLEAVAELAAAYGFLAPNIIDMPANNLILVFRRTADSAG